MSNPGGSEGSESEPIPIEPVREIGAEGQPLFERGHNFGEEYTLCGFWKDPAGIVHMQGVITVPAPGASGEPLFTLPVGYRPAKRSIFTSVTGVQFSVNPNGHVALDAGAAANYNLDHIQFRTPAGNLWP